MKYHILKIKVVYKHNEIAFVCLSVRQWQAVPNYAITLSIMNRRDQRVILQHTEKCFGLIASVNYL